jgi:hypothetical protein
MNKRYFAIAFALFGSAIIVAAIYLSVPGTQSTNQQRAISGPSKGSAASKGQEQTGNGTTTLPVIDVGPLEAYSSNPPRPEYQESVLGIARNRDTSEEVKVQQLLALLPRLPEDGKVLAMEHAAKLIPDEDYLKHRARLLQLANTKELREVVLVDVLTRDDSVRMTSLVEFLRHTASEDQAEVREVLEAFLDKDFGSDALQWEIAVQQYLRENADS